MAQLFNSLDKFPDSLRAGALAIGNFDGVHLGHARLIQALVQKAKETRGPAVVLTFDPPPVVVLVPDRPPTLPLTSIRRRAELLGALGVDALIAYPTDRQLLSLSPDAFFQQKILDAIGAKAVVEGPNFRFGKDRAGDTELLGQLCSEAGVDLEVVSAEESGGKMISSTRIRDLLGQGDVAAVNEMLTQPYSIEGVVVKGAQRGRTIGFPTANLESLSSLTPSHGVYAGRATVNAQEVPAAIHIGPNPTFGEQKDKIEIHLIDWQGTIYGEKLRCQLLEHVRSVRQFDSKESLQKQLHLDVATCRNITNG